ncbi:EamA family transporter [Mesorhizobium kowhaii]|uniref:EamA family transporter n=1 Tax=Mesorhizobium kowhaii TaxID=1300272 RepID=UPI002478FE7D|nr:EamA family transporter [Mesorhizobium kowhaii]
MGRHGRQREAGDRRRQDRPAAGIETGGAVTGSRFPALCPISALLVGLFSSALPFWLEMVALTRMPARIYGTLTCLEPGLGALAGFLFLDESLTAPQLAGIAAVIAAAFGAALTSRPPVPSPE